MANEADNSAAPTGLVQGVLYVVGTPIGNLEDISLRALRTLQEVDLIACEDTRQTAKLLSHYGIPKPTISYYEHNELTRAAELVKRLEEGTQIALVSDAGMPGVSDPGYRVVSLAIQRGIRVVPIPGASALLSALVASGLGTDCFQFGGFLPPKSGARRTALEALRESSSTHVYYEAPHRLVETWRDVVATLGATRRVVVAREVTKMHEEFLRGSAGEVLSILQQRGDVRGEITLLIDKAEPRENVRSTTKNVAQRVKELVAEAKLDEKSALKQAAKEFGISRSEAYRELQRTNRNAT